MARRVLLLPVLALLATFDAAAACAPPPLPARDLDLPRFYGDAAGSKIDPARQAAHDAAVAPLTAFLREVTQNADKAWSRPSPKSQAEAAACALSWIEAWAAGDAWLGRMATQQAEYQRKWDLAGVALAYVKVRSFARPEQRARIEPWLLRFADAARAFFDDPARRRNNHWYWLGLGLAGVGLAADSQRHWDMARDIMKDAARDVRDDGALPLELERQSRALFYHAFAVMPLVVTASLAATRGEDWYAFGDGALHRLVALTHRGLNQPALFDALAATKQDPKINTRAGWLQLYLQRFPDRLTGPHPHVAEGHRWIGGRALTLGAAAAPSR